jgi:MraZ protein
VLFTGTSEVTIDAKQRLSVPARYRAQLEASGHPAVWYCVPWSARLIRLYPEKTFETLASMAGTGSLMPAEDEAELEAAFFGLAERIEADAAGRLVIPRPHLEIARLTPEVVVIGARNRLEIRDRGAWQGSTPERFAKMPVTAALLESRRAATPLGAPGQTSRNDARSGSGGGSGTNAGGGYWQ